LCDIAAVFRGYPAAVRTDNGPDFTSRALIAWTIKHHVRHLLIEPGEPMQNGYIESFNGKFRDECLSLEWFRSRAEAAIVIEVWRRHYNAVRPHSSLEYLTPHEFKQQHHPIPTEPSSRNRWLEKAGAGQKGPFVGSDFHVASWRSLRSTLLVHES
jgi:hypothetical protein